MPICCDCEKDVPKSGFAKSQLKKAPEKRRCKKCAQPLSGDEPAAPAEVHPCWVCLCDDGGDGVHGLPRRDCSCRGTAGYVHITCLVDMASKKADAIDISPKNTSMKGLGVSVGGNVLNPWRECMTCRQAYRGDTLYHLAKACEAKYCQDNPSAPAFWKSAAYDNLSGVLMARGEVPGAMEALQKRLDLLKNQYRYEVRCGRNRADISCTRDIVNVLVNLSSIIIEHRRVGLGSPETVRTLLDEAQRYADQKQSRDGGYLRAIVWRHRATLEDSLDNSREALRLMQKAVAVLEKDPGYLTSFNGIRTQWELSEIMIRAACDDESDGDGLWAGYELQEQTVATARRVLGTYNPYVIKIGTELKEFQERMGGEWIEYGRAFRGMNARNPTAETKKEAVLATGWCYTRQCAKITGVTDAGYRGLLSKGPILGMTDSGPLIDPNSDDDDWEANFIPFPAICLDSGTLIVLHDYDAEDKKHLNGKMGVVRGFEYLDNETHNFDKLLLQVDVDGVGGRLLVSPKNAKVQVK